MCQHDDGLFTESWESIPLACSLNAGYLIWRIWSNWGPCDLHRIGGVLFEAGIWHNNVGVMLSRLVLFGFLIFCAVFRTSIIVLLAPIASLPWPLAFFGQTLIPIAKLLALS